MNAQMQVFEKSDVIEDNVTGAKNMAMNSHGSSSQVTDKEDNKGRVMEIIQVEPATDEEVVFDAERRRATHVESGLAVEYVRDEEPRECMSHFTLTVDGKEIPFAATTDAGEKKIREQYPKEQYPDMSVVEKHKLVQKLNEKNYNIHVFENYDLYNDVFLKTFHKLVSSIIYFRRVSAYVLKFQRDVPGPGEYKAWGCEG